MRTPNCKCLICSKPLYRRPSELAKVRHVACFEHRAKAQSISGVTPAQQAGLSLGREKGTNHRTGYRHTPEAKKKASASHLKWCAENPDKVNARAEKLRGEQHYRWNGGVSKLNLSIRQMNENRKWMEAVKDRDGRKCVRCGSGECLESHHKKELAVLIQEHGITSRDDARNIAELWDISNGETLCERCHYSEHGRIYAN